MLSSNADVIDSTSTTGIPTENSKQEMSIEKRGTDLKQTVTMHTEMSCDYTNQYWIMWQRAAVRASAQHTNPYWIM